MSHFSIFMKKIFVIFLTAAGIALNAGFPTVWAATDCTDTGTTGIPQTECETLIAFYNSTDGPNWSDSSSNNWDSATACNTWEGVGVIDGRVSDVLRPGKDLSGNIPDLSALTALMELNLSGNDLSGNIPGLSAFPNLLKLNLSGNQLSGNIPALDVLPSLRELDMSGNQLESLPALTALGNLRKLLLNSNQLTGNIPDLSSLTNLQELDFSDNQLDGSIPSLAALGNLTRLELFNNQLSGAIPDLGSLGGLETLRLNNNQLEGNIPALDVLVNLQELSLSGNQLEGAIPDLSNLAALTRLFVSGNRLDGDIPVSLNSLTNLQELNISDNQLSGTIPDLSSLTALTQLKFTNNSLSGTLDSFLPLTNLQDLWLSGNQLAGSIPDLSSLSSLQSLYLAENQLEGEIPSSLSSLSLAVLDLTYNKLTASDTDMITFLDEKNRKWSTTQTIPPGNLSFEPLTATSIRIIWDTIPYEGDSGYYRIKRGDTRGGPYAEAGVTESKRVGEFEVTGLSAGTYYFVVETSTPAHDDQQSDLTSVLSAELEVEFEGMPEIGVKTYDTEVPDGGSFNFGSAVLGTPLSVIFTVENTGNAELTLTEPIVLPEGFTLAESFDSINVSPSDSAAFEVRLNDTLGNFEGELSFGNNDADENPYNFTIRGMVNPAPEPEIEVSENGGDIPNSGALSFGTTLVGTPVIKTLTIANTGTAALKLENFQLPTGFTLVGAFPDTLGAGTTDDFQIRLDADSENSFTGELTFDSNDTDESTYSFGISGTVTPVPAPEIEISENGMSIPFNGNFDFGTTLIGTPVKKTFVIRNTGTALLTIDNLTMTAAFSLAGALPDEIAPGETDNLEIQLDANAVGTFGGDLRIANNDADENPYVFTISGTVNPEPEPEIGVSENGSDIPNDGNMNFGSTTIGTSLSKTLIIENTGTAELLLSNLILPDGFSLVTAFPENIPANDAASFQIRLDADAAGSFIASLGFDTNDSDENPFRISIRGSVNPEADIQVLAGSLVMPNGESLDFGATDTGKPVAKNFVIRNNGTETLILGDLALPKGFSLVGTFPDEVGAGEEADFQILLNADTAGNFPGMLEFDTNDKDENSFRLSLSGSVTMVPEPEIRMLDGTSQIPNLGKVNFGITDISLPLTRTFTIENTGSALLTLGIPQLPKGFTLIGEFPNAVEVGESADFQIQLDAEKDGKFKELIQFESNDPDEAIFSVTIKGTVNPEPAPEIETSAEDVEIPNSGAFDFGSTVIDSPLVRTLVISNIGTDMLRLGNVEMPGGFSIVGEFPEKISSGESADVRIQLDARTVGDAEGILRFDSNDADEASYSLILRGRVNAEPEPEIDLWKENTEIPDGGEVHFGSSTAGIPVTETFRVRNTGTAELNLADPELPPGFSLPGIFPGSIAAGESAEFQIRLDAETAAYFDGTLRFASNDADENPFSLRIDGTIHSQPEPEIRVSDEEGMDLGDQEKIDFGTTMNGAPVLKRFIVENTGTLMLNPHSLTLPEGFSLVGAFPYNVRPGGTESFQVQLDAVSDGLFQGTLLFHNNDADENPFVIILSGNVTLRPEPEIEVLSVTELVTEPVEVPNDGTVSFGNTIPGMSVTKIFMIRNTGTAPLHLSNPEFPDDFIPVGQFPEQIAAGAEENFQVQFDAFAPGVFEGFLSFDNNDADENPFSMFLRTEVFPEPEPEIEVLSVTEPVEVPDGGAFAFGTATAGSPVTETFVIRNNGAEILRLDNPDLPEAFFLVGEFPKSIEPGASEQFSIGLESDTASEFSGTLSFENNDADENPYNFAISGTVLSRTEPEIEIWDNDTLIPNGEEVVADIGTTTQGLPLTKTFEIRNTGNAALSLGILHLPDDFSLVTPFPESIAAGAADSFQIQLTAQVTGEVSGMLQFENNDADENPYTFMISASVVPDPEPEIQVSENGTGILNRGEVNFGNTLLGTAIVKSFSVRNSGIAVLNLGNISVPQGFRVIGDFPEFVAARGTDSFQIQFDASSEGVFSGELSFDTNDRDENPFVFTIGGTVQGQAEIEVRQEDTLILNGDILDLGNTGLGSPIFKVVDISNRGTAMLSLGTPTLPSGFSLVGLFPAEIPEGGTERFQIQLDADAPGTFEGIFSFDSNDSDNASHSFSLKGTVTAEIPRIVGQHPLETPEETPLLISLNDLIAEDPDSIFPDDFTLSVHEGEGYRIAGIFEKNQDTAALIADDMDGDGHIDLIMGNDGQTNRLYLNNGTDDPFAGVAGKEISQETRHTRSLVSGDIDGDGDIDLIAGNYGERNRLYLNNGTDDPFRTSTGSVTGSTGLVVGEEAGHTLFLVLGDVDGDGDLDLIAGNYGEANRLYLNNGTKDPFGGVSGSPVSSDEDHTQSLVLGDVDADGDLDLIAGNDGETNRVYLSNGKENPFDGVFASDIGTEAHHTQSLVLGDVDADGDLDLIAGNRGEANLLYLSNGSENPFDGTEGEPVSDDEYHTVSLALGDVDADGDLDLIAGNDGETNRLYLNNGSEEPFEEVIGRNISGDRHYTRSLIMGDVNGDGDEDMIVAGNKNTAGRLYLSNGSENPFDGVFAVKINALSDTVIIPDIDFNGVLGVPVSISDGVNESEIFNLSVTVNEVNDTPVILGQKSLSLELVPSEVEAGEISLTISPDDLEADDPDNDFPDDFTLSIYEGENYRFEENTVFPAEGFTGKLSIPVTIHDGKAESNLFHLEVNVFEGENIPPVITGQESVETDMETPLTIRVYDLLIDDPDSVFPDDFALTVLDGENYLRSGNTVTPADQFSGMLSVPVSVNDGINDSEIFDLSISVRAEAQNPIANAGTDQRITEGRTVFLDASASTYPGKIVSYLWEQTDGISVTLSDPADAKPTFVTPPVDAEGEILSFQLIVGDADGNETRDETAITISDNGIRDFPADVLSFETANGKNMGIRVLSGGDPPECKACFASALHVIDADSIPESQDKPESLIYGLIQTEIRVSEEGGTVVLVIWLPEPAPENAVWYQYSSEKGWLNLSANAVFNDARDQITVTLKDGGTGDEDGVANGIITGVYGLGVPPSQETSSDNDDDGDSCFISTASGPGNLGSAGMVAAFFAFVFFILSSRSQA